MVEPVVTMLSKREPRLTRNSEERFVARFPRTFRAMASLSAPLISRPDSKRRQVVLRRGLESSWDAISRGDYDVDLGRMAPDVEVTLDETFGELGLEGVHQGHQGFRHVFETTARVWPGWRLQPLAMYDLGDPIVVLGIFHVPGDDKQPPFQREMGHVMSLREGVVAKVRDSLSWDNALRMAGIDPQSVPLPAA